MATPFTRTIWSPTRLSQRAWLQFDYPLVVVEADKRPPLLHATVVFCMTGRRSVTWLWAAVHH